MDINSRIDLNDGNAIPGLGFGTYRLDEGGQSRHALEAAFDAGYRHIDTAAIYGNEQSVGEAIAASGLGRYELFVTTKLWNDSQGYESALRACSDSLKRLGLDYVDLYLIHWPMPSIRLESWRALEKLKADGYCKSIGVSNFTERHLDELLAASETVPAINQVELHPLLVQDPIRRYCNSQNIAVEAYTPLMKGGRVDDDAIHRIASDYGKTWSQILIRWSLQHRLICLPKSATPERILENSQVFDFELSEEDMDALDDLDQRLHLGWDPYEMA